MQVQQASQMEKKKTFQKIFKVSVRGGDAEEGGEEAVRR